MDSFDYDAEIAFSSPAPGFWAGRRGFSPADWSEPPSGNSRTGSQTLAQTSRTHLDPQRGGAGRNSPDRHQAGGGGHSPLLQFAWIRIRSGLPGPPAGHPALGRDAGTTPREMVDPCGEDSHMPVPGLVHRYPDRVLFLVTDRCASYCRYCTRSRVVSGSRRTTPRDAVGGGLRVPREHAAGSRRPCSPAGIPSSSPTTASSGFSPASTRVSSTSSSCGSAARMPGLSPPAHHAGACATCCRSTIPSSSRSTNHPAGAHQRGARWTW